VRPIAAALFALAALAACSGGGADDAPATADVLRGLAADYEWPARLPDGAALEAFASAGGGGQRARFDIERANACAWYERWLALHRGDETGDLAPVEAYLADTVRTFEFVRSAAGGVEYVESVADSARRGDEAPILAFIEANKCELLGG